MKTNRRQLLQKGLLASAALFAVPAKALTPRQPEGPFYPVVDQVDTDADLIMVKGASHIAEGKIIIVEGKLTDQFNAPVAGVLVEIWQACETGKYNHPSDPNTAALDPFFQYWGKAVTNQEGHYRFRTIVPGDYPADTDWMRPPHIHFKVSKRGYMELITQMYFAGEVYNSTDKILQQLPKTEQQKLIVELREVEGLAHPVGEFNIQVRKL